VSERGFGKSSPRGGGRYPSLGLVVDSMRQSTKDFYSHHHHHHHHQSSSSSSSSVFIVIILILIITAHLLYRDSGLRS
jgi:hypothetical protein